MKNTNQNKDYKLMMQQIVKNIPYDRVFEEEGLFESDPNVFSKAYAIEDVEAENVKSVSNEMIMRRFSQLVNEIPDSMTMQFIIHNGLVSQEEFLKKVLIVPDKSRSINDWIDKYNRVVVYNSSIGHNNVKKSKYFILSVKADLPEDAVKLFRDEDKHIKELFKGICDISIKSISVTERLHIMYSMFNPSGTDFGSKADIKGDGSFSLHAMKQLRLTTKDIIAPDMFDSSNKSYMILNGDTYVRTFFITSVPAYVSNNLISDITNSSSNMVFSAIYEPMDSNYGFDVATKNVSDNTLVKQQAKRDTIRDRKEKSVVKIETMIQETEDKYFDRSALKLMQESVAAGEKAMLCTFVIALYANDLETLERDTKLLHISTSKFACQVKSLDLQQVQGLQTVLPLAYNRVDCRRTFTVHKLAQMSPLNVQEVLQEDGLYNGLNSINDNLVLLNRKNNVNMAGLIAGTDHSGKTFQCKREIFNAAISTGDRIVILSSTNAYDNFVRALGGEVMDSLRINPFSMNDHYGLVNPDKYSKSLFLEALIECLNQSKEKVIQTQNVAFLAEHESMSDDRRDTIVNEVDRFIKEMEGHSLDWKNDYIAMHCINSNKEKFPFFSKAVDFIDNMNKDRTAVLNPKKRIQLIKFGSEAEALMLLDCVFNQQISDKMKNLSTWVFLDSYDGVFRSDQTSSFLIDYVERMNALQNIFTMVIQSSVKLFADNNMSYRVSDFVNQLGYFKLLNQGAIERKKYTELLNIPNSLVNYITSAELGKGIICTSSSNMAFDDGFLVEDDDVDEPIGNFYRLFKI